MKKLIQIVALASVLIAVPLTQTGCSSMTVQDKQLIAKVAVSYATIKVVEKNPAYAAKIAAIAKSVKDVADGETAYTVALLDAYVRSRIDWTKLSAADMMLVNALLDEVKLQLEARIGNGTLDSAKLLVVKEVATWIETAALSAAPAAP